MFSGLSAGFLNRRNQPSGSTSNVNTASSERKAQLHPTTPSAPVSEALKQCGRDPKLPGTQRSVVTVVDQQLQSNPEPCVSSTAETKSVASQMEGVQQQQSRAQPSQQQSDQQEKSTREQSQEKQQSSQPQPEIKTLAVMRQPEALNPTGSSPKLPGDADAGHTAAAEKSKSSTGVVPSKSTPQSKQPATCAPQSGCQMPLRRSQRKKRIRSRADSARAGLRSKP
jgi:hypothetical protein